MVALGKRQGFTFVALDLAGFASGSLNQLVGLRRARALTHRSDVRGQRDRSRDPRNGAPWRLN